MKATLKGIKVLSASTIILLAMFLAACGGGGGGGDGGGNGGGGGADLGTTPTINKVELFNTDDPGTPTLSFDIGDKANITVDATDPDLDMETMYLTQYYYGTLYDGPDPLVLPPQDKDNDDMIYDFPGELTFNGPAGNWRIEFQIEDAEGNKSSVKKVNVVVNISYTGLTTPAMIDEYNAADLLGGAYAGGRLGGILIGFGDLQAGEVSSIYSPSILNISQVLEEALRRVDFTSGSGGTLLVTIPWGGTIDGDCGGSASYIVYVDTVTGEFNDGSITFNDYCSGGITISGDADFSGQIDPDTLYTTQDILRYSLSFENLLATSDADSFTFTGDIEGDNTVSPAIIITDMLLRDNNTEKVYKFVDYTMSITEGEGYVEIELSGRYYDPDYGYVDIATTTPFLINDGDDWPSEGGELVITGASNTKARLTAKTPPQCQVEADTNGDGTYDWGPVVMEWSEL